MCANLIVGFDVLFEICSGVKQCLSWAMPGLPLPSRNTQIPVSPTQCLNSSSRSETAGADASRITAIFPMHAARPKDAHPRLLHVCYLPAYEAVLLLAACRHSCEFAVVVAVPAHRNFKHKCCRRHDALELVVRMHCL